MKTYGYLDLHNSKPYESVLIRNPEHKLLSRKKKIQAKFVADKYSFFFFFFQRKLVLTCHMYFADDSHEILTYFH